ncbi:MAG: hypothetical protein GF330_09680 [Candidatus Eisenbacteria bacterium]|nr:hypothetical protein [Candidatus Eisenbacteria bacterium]
MKRQIPMLLAIVASIYPILAFFVPVRAINVWNTKLDEWMVIIASFALLLGIISVIQVNIHKIRRREKNWIFSVVILVTFVIMAGFGLFGRQGERPEGGYYPFTWVFNYAFSPLQATMFSLLAFYVASAAYRAFRVRNIDATLLLIGALIIMIGRVPLGKIMLPFMPEWAEWVMRFPNAAAQRGIIIGAALGAAAMSIRVMVGIEKPYLGKS